MHKFNLIENAKDSLEHAVLHISEAENDEPSEWKRVILDLSHVVELLLKERLRQTHPAFIYSNIDKFPSKKPYTVNADIALSRLEKLCEVQFTPDDLKNIKAIREKRNDIEHFEFEIASKEAKILIGTTLGFIMKFASDELKLDWRDEHFKQDFWSVLIDYVEFYKQQLAFVDKKISDDEIYTIECSSCSNDTFSTEEEICLLCGHRESVLECIHCQDLYLYSSVEYDEAGLCSACEDKDGYAAANHEKY